MKAKTVVSERIVWIQRNSLVEELSAFAEAIPGEIGWTYTKGGVCNGSFESVGTFVLDPSGNTFSGPGAFKQFDLSGKLILTDNFTVIVTKLPV